MTTFHRAALLSAIRDAIPRGPDSYHLAVRIYADWLEEAGDAECERVRRLLPAAAWACERRVVLPECELVEGRPWEVWHDSGREFDRSSVLEPVGFARHCLRRPCAGEYLGMVEYTGRIGDIRGREFRHVVLMSVAATAAIIIDGWNGRTPTISPPVYLDSDDVQSLVFSCAGKPPIATAARAKRPSPEQRFLIPKRLTGDPTNYRGS